MKNLALLSSLFVFLLLCGTASAVGVTVRPHQVQPGDTITVTALGLSDESVIEMDWEVYVDQPGPEFMWEVHNLTFPINLEDASVRVTNQNTLTNTVTLENEVPGYGTRGLSLSGDSVDGIWTAYHGNDFINGTWPIIRNEGTVEPGKTSILSLVEWHGTKRANPLIPQQVNGGADDFSIPLSFSGFENGRVKFTIRVNGTMVATETVTVGRPVSRTGTLYVRSSPSAAIVYVDGVYYGLTPRKVTGVAPGLRLLKLTKEGYADYTEQVDVSIYGITVVVVTLNPTSATVRVSSLPRLADVYLDDQPVGKTPLTIKGVEPGIHILKLTKQGYQDHITTLTVADGETIRLPLIILHRSQSSGRFDTADIPRGEGAGNIPAGYSREEAFDRVMERFRSAE